MKKLCNKRTLAIALVLVLVLSIVGGIIPASAAEEMIAVVAKPLDGWTPYLWAWDGIGNAVFGSWPGEAMTALGDGWYYAYVPVGTTGVIVSNNGSPQTADGKISGDKDAWLTVNDDLTITAAYTKQNTAAIPSYEPEPTYTVTVHYHNTNNWEKVYAHFGQGDSWTPIAGYEGYKEGFGQEIAQNANNEGWYDFTVTKEGGVAINFLYNCGEWGDGKQDGNFTTGELTGNTELWVEGGQVLTSAPAGWSTGSTDVPEETVPEETNPEETVPETTEPETDVPEETVPEETVPEDNGAILISDHVQVKIGEKLYDMNVVAGAYEAAVKASAGTATVVVNGEETEITCEVPAGDIILQLKGDKLRVVTPALVAIPGFQSYLGLSMGDWCTDKPAMNYIGNGWYTYTFTFDALAADVDYEFKITIGNTWDDQINDGAGNNIKLHIPAGTTSLTIMVDLNNRAVYNSIEMPQITDVVSIIGQVRGETDTWTPEAKGWEFTQVTDNLYVYEMDLTAGTYEYKCVINYATWYEKEGIGNRVLTLNADAHVVFVYDSESGYLYDSVNNTQKVADLLGHMGPDSDPNNAQTGDSFQTVLMGSVLLLAVAGISVLVANRKRWIAG